MKTVFHVEMYCLRCKKKVMKAVCSLTGVNHVDVDMEKKRVTVVGDVDPVKVAKKLKKANRTAQILTAGPEKEEPKKEKPKEEKKETLVLPSCKTCETLYLGFPPSYGWPAECAIL